MQKCSKEALKLKLDNDAIKKSMLLYAITDRGWLKEGETLESVVEDVLKSGATFLQLREKIQGHEEIVKTAINLQTLCKKYNVPFVVNDDIMAAKEIDADGVHIGQSDMEYTKAREILGPDKIIGVSAQTVEQAIKALAGLTEGNKLVGIISHVGELKERIDRQIIVTKEKAGGSRAEII